MKEILTTRILVYKVSEILDVDFVKAIMSATLQEWPVKLLSVEDLEYKWPYGTRALISERERVREIQALQAGFLRGHWVSHDPLQNYFKLDMSFAEAFVGCDAERISLKDRVTTYYNCDWKREATARVEVRLANGSSLNYTDGQQQHFVQLMREAEQRYCKLMHDLLLLQGLTSELKPETRGLIKSCTSYEQLLACMLNAKE
jgi:hypothetical protein